MTNKEPELVVRSRDPTLLSRGRGARSVSHARRLADGRARPTRRNRARTLSSPATAGLQPGSSSPSSSAAGAQGNGAGLEPGGPRTFSAVRALALARRMSILGTTQASARLARSTGPRRTSAASLRHHSQLPTRARAYRLTRARHRVPARRPRRSRAPRPRNTPAQRLPPPPSSKPGPWPGVRNTGRAGSPSPREHLHARVPVFARHFDPSLALLSLYLAGLILSCPHAASASIPRDQRTVATMPASSSTMRKFSARSLLGRPYCARCTGL